LLSGIQNTLSRQNIGAWGIFTRTGSTIAVFGRIHRPVESEPWFLC
jgi:hypothetical protein